MWEVIEKNKASSMIAFSVMTIWYTFIYGLICAFVILFIIKIIYDVNDKLILNNYIIYRVTLIGILICFTIFIVRFIQLKNKPYKFDSCGIYPINKSKNSMLFNVVEEVAIAAGVTKLPKIYILNSNILNAYACGINPDNASIVISKALLKTLSRDELQGVIAHEMSHIVNRDTTYLLCSGALYAISAAFTLFFWNCIRSRGNNRGNAGILLLLILSLFGQVICFILFMFISRKREYLADACACQYTRYPKGLADALIKISSGMSRSTTEYNPDKLVKASCIVPLTKKKVKNWFEEIKSTHPSTQNRIKILLNMTSADYKEYEREFQKLNKTNLIPKSAINDSETLPIKKVIENIKNPAIVAACAISSKVSDDKQVQTIKENKEVLKENIKKHREVDDLVRDLAGYTVINCECGTKLKIPPVYKNTIVICPHCKKKHVIS